MAGAYNASYVNEEPSADLLLLLLNVAKAVVFGLQTGEKDAFVTRLNAMEHIQKPSSVH